MKKAILLALLFSVSAFIFAQKPGDNLFDTSYVHRIDVDFYEPNFWDTLEYYYLLISDPMTGLPLGPKKYLPAKITIDGNVLDTIGFRQKGFFSNWGASGSMRKPFKVDINEFVKGQRYDGLRKFNLQNSFGDPSLMRDMLSYDLMRNAGVPAPRTAYARVYLNNQYWGLYLLLEQIDKEFLDAHFSSKKGNLYKAIASCHLDWQGPNPADYKDELELKTNEDEDDWTDLIRLINIINNTPQQDFVDSISNIFEVDEFLKVLAMDVMMLNWDSYYDHGRNFYMYQNPDTRKFHWIPWDYNLSFSSTEVDILFNDLKNQGGWNKPLIESILAVDSFENMFLDHYCTAIHGGNFDSTRLFPFMDRTQALLHPLVAFDPHFFYSLQDFNMSLDQDVIGGIGFPARGLKPFVRDRILTVRQELGNWGHVCQPNVSINDPLTYTPFILYPNPAQSSFYIELDQPIASGRILLRNELGQLVRDATFTGTEMEVDVNNLPAGLYVAEVIGKDIRVNKKVLVR